MSDGDFDARFRVQDLLEASLSFEYLEGDTRDNVPGRLPTVARPYVTVGQVQFASFWVETAGAEPVEVRAGEGYVLPPGVPVGYEIRGVRRARFVWTHVNYYVFDSLNLFQLLECPVGFPRKIGRAFGDINRELHALAEDRAPSIPTIARKKALGFRLLAMFLDASAPAAAGPIEGLAEIQRVLPVLAFVKNNLSEKITRKMLADQVLLSETHFHSCFKKAMGIAPMEYVQRQRMQRAQQLLMQSTDPVARIAGRVGFDDPFYFSRQFRAALGMSPSEYRERRSQMVL